MQLIEPVPDDEMIAAFLRAEVDSSRFGKDVRSFLARYGRGLAILRTPNTGRAEENRIRREILGSFRGYGNGKLLFPGFPENVEWWRAHLDVTDLQSTLYCSHPEWITLSGGSRRVVDGASAVNDDNASENARLTRRIVEAIRNGRSQAALIFVATSETGPFITLEGHKRITAYALTSESIPDGVDALIGVSANMNEWRYF